MTINTNEPRTRAEKATQAIREGIDSGSLAPGSRILVEEVADSIGMSASPVREALRSLASEGLVTLNPHRGYQVADFDLGDLSDTYMVRRVLEPMTLSLSAPHLTEEDFAKIHRSLAQLADAYESGDWSVVSHYHREFHQGLLSRAGSPWLARIQEMLWGNSERYQRASSARRGSRHDRIDAHRAILDACESGRYEEAVVALEEHLVLTEEVVSRIILEQEDG